VFSKEILNTGRKLEKLLVKTVWAYAPMLLPKRPITCYAASCSPISTSIFRLFKSAFDFLISQQVA
jgi:hypothetical protein